MQLTKTKEKEVLKAYNIWMHSYLNGDVATYDSYLDDDYHFIGSTDNEEFLTRKDTTNFFKDTAEQFAGKTELRNETTTLELFGELVFITHVFDAWFLNGNDWTYYARFRFSSVLKEKEDGWRFIYQHFSIADSKADEGETIGFDKVNLENQELREAIKRRTFELEEKNRELEVEGALERIRAQAVAMQQTSDLLDIVVTMRNEFIKLGHEAHYFWHMMWLPEKYEKAMTSGDGTKIGFVIELPRHIHGDIPLLANWEKSDDSLVIYPMDAEDAIAYVDKMFALGDFQNIDPQAPSHDDIRHIDGLTFIMARTSHGEIGYSLPGVVENPPKEDLELLERFAGAFDLAHRRFLDLQKAEKQRRETQIELALEKVRSRTMGMQRSDELRDTAMLLFQQVEELGIPSFACGFNIWDEDKKAATAWMASEDRLQPPFKTNSSEDVYLLFHEAEKRGDSLFVLEQKGKELEDHYKYLVSIPEVKALAQAGLSFPTFQIIHCAFFSKGYLMFITHESVPDAHDIFKRFAKVFEQTYTRFLDLQKAEAQTREAKIEAALERVRSRSMAMHATSELQEVIETVHKEFKTLNIAITGGVFIAINQDIKEEINCWGAGSTTDYIERVHVPFFNSPIYTGMIKKILKGPGFFIEQFSHSQKKKFFAHLFKHPPYSNTSKKHQKELLNREGGYTRSCAVSENTSIFMINHHGEKFSETDNKILRRFSKVFEQTYTRFLDLQKAEVQARESEIELALERVRARTMAMQHSDELQEASFLLDQQVRALGIKTWGCAFNIYGEKESTEWFGNEAGVLPTYSVPRAGIFKEYYQKGQKGESLIIKEFSGKACVDHYEYMSSLPVIGDVLKNLKKTNNGYPTYQIDHVVYFKHGYLLFITKEHVPEAHDIFKRFAKVFEQTYTRFLDLQKAEAQAREALIETALEKVRSAMMAMHRSNELREVIKTIFLQLQSLNFGADASAVIIYDENYGAEHWFSGYTHDTYPKSYTIPYIKKFKYNTALVDAWKNKEAYQSFLMKGKPKIKYGQWLLKHTDFKDLPEEFTKHAVSPDPLVLNDAFNKYGMLEVLGPEELSEEQSNILKRFSKVFEQTYTRFLDLQKAEAQAREAQIETALEKVRSRTMAMQKSKDLAAVIENLFYQLKELDLKVISSWVSLVNVEKNTMEIWVSHGENKITPVVVKGADFENFQEEIEAWKNKQELVLIKMPKEIAQNTLKEFFQIDLLLPKEDSLFHLHQLWHEHGFLGLGMWTETSKEEYKILQRFTQVFEQTYTRFLDLQKAEAQARESEIELALERVRARTMAMQQSSELPEASNNLFLQVQELGIPAWSAGYCIWDKDKKNATSNMSTRGVIQKPFTIPNSGEGYNFQKPLQNREAFHVQELGGRALVKHYEFMRTIPVFAEVIDGIIAAGFPLPKFQIFHIVYFTHGYLMFITYEPVPNAHDIFKRFGKVFQQTYTRFLDLQKAEAQAREAQIELALERVRSKAMSMMASDELAGLIVTIFNELQHLDMELTRCLLWIFNSEDQSGTIWITNSEDPDRADNYHIPYHNHTAYKRFLKGWKSQEQNWEYHLKGKNKASWDETLVNGYLKNLSAKVKRAMKNPEQVTLSGSFNKYGVIQTAGLSPLSNENQEILQRFSQVFEQTYTRFLDLQKAEAQAREAKIEAALEKVRSRSLAMHNSNEVGEVANILLNKLQELEATIDNEAIITVHSSDGSRHSVMWLASPELYASALPFHLPYMNHPLDRALWDAIESGTEYFTKRFSNAVKNKWFKWAFEHSDFKLLPEERKQAVLDSKDYRYFIAIEKNTSILIPCHTGKLLSSAQIEILKRFSRVFEQAYIRFLDLQKAEAQAREARIETALEKVRSRTMAMQKGEELQDVVVLLYKELIALGVTNFATCGYVEVNEKTNRQLTWVTSPGGDSLGLFHIPLTGDSVFDERYEAWKRQQIVFHQTVAGKKRSKHLEYAITTFNSKEAEEMILNQFPDPTVFYCFNFSHGYLHLVTGSLLTKEEEALLARFTRVFEQTYARFLDLKKAEAQAREAQIEMALEKVRSRTMAMQQSEELPVAANNLFLQVQDLGIPAWSAGYCIWENDKKSSLCNMSSEGEIQKNFSLPTIGEGYNFFDSIKNSEPFHVAEIGGKALVKHYDFMKKLPIVGEVLADFKKKGISLPTFQIFHIVYFSHGYLMFITYEPVPNDWDIFKRFGKVFEQTYTRFLDLEKAEAQTRQAQISLAVERVRAKALAMHKSEEIMEVVAKLKDEVMSLDIPDVIAATIFLSEGENKVRMWDLSSLEKLDGVYQSPLDITFKLKKADPHLYPKRVWENPENYFVEIQEGKDFKRIIAWLREHGKNEIANETEAFIKTTQLKQLYHAVKKLNNGKLVIDLLNPPSYEMETILTKMGAAFDLAYKRFEDLQKAEAQTREALIEAALEKVRSRSLAMHKPEELQEIVTVVAEKLKELGVILDAGGVIICTYFPDNKDVMHWIAAPDFSHSGSYFIPYFDDRTFNEAWDSKNSGESYFSQAYPQEDKNKFFEYAFEHSDYRNFPDEFKQLILQSTEYALSFAWQKNSAILIPSHSGILPSESDEEIMKRFAKVFEQAYIRFMDLQKAEAQGREAQIEAALERVRSRTLAMQKSEELAETSVVVFKQLLELGISPNRLFIGIIKDNATAVEAWATNEDGSKIEQHFKLYASKNKSIKKMVAGWKQQKKSTIIDMKGKELQAYFHYLNTVMHIPFINGLKQKRRVQSIAYFSGGFIGMAAPEEQPKETIELLERFAAVFNLTYTRFNDLKIAEANTEKAEQDLIKLQAAKKSAEEALSELQTTQTQLIQSEKMASLGELTAGIAHEIQNPLNFVNNFSEVSKELLDEMLEEIENGDMLEVRAIMADVIQNLEKINHHGQRADGIVKGMLQHSRASGDKKEPTDINALADEYLRLAYHGLRAKDKAFNSQLITDFDDSIKTINIIPQDIGRVILNLLTNAFYVVNEKKKSGLDGYEPSVSIVTKKTAKAIKIIVSDNGNGIPESVKEKIFQPFFTTKPTGQGTGLGLSLSYDIITAHGGELKVNSTEGQGTEMIISLPIKD